jgi:hypothetical protein
VAELLKTAEAQQAEHDLAAARKTLERAYQLQPSAEILCALGSLALRAGRTVDGLDALRRCAASPDKIELAGGWPAALPASGELSVIGPRRALVFVDDHVVGALPLTRPLLLAPGRHQLQLDVGGRRLAAPVEVLAGRAAQLNLAGKPAVTLTPAVALRTDFARSVDGMGPRLREVTAQAVRSQHLGLLGQWGGLGESLDLGSCADAACAQGIAERYQLRYVLSARLFAEPDGWQLWTQLFDAEVGGVASEEAASCEHCTSEQASARLGELLARTLSTGQQRPTGVLEVTSTPPGGEVLLGGLRLGQTPLRRTAFAGEHAVVVRRAGFAPYQNEVVVEPGRGAALDATLHELAGTAPPPPPPASGPPIAESAPASPAAPAPEPPLAASLRLRPPPPMAIARPSARLPRPRWRLGVGISATLVGAALIGFGIAGLALDGRCTATPVAAAGGELCPSGRVVDSRLPGIALLGVGLVTAGAGATLWALPSTHSDEASAALGRPAASGIVALASGSF